MAFEPPDVVISIVNTGHRELLRACLRSLPPACEGLRWKATVVDNVSDDGSFEMVSKGFSWADLLRNDKRLGFSTNHNRVIRQVLSKGSARYLLILNEDTELDPGSVAALVELCDANPRLGAAGPLVRGEDGRIQPSLFRFPTVRSELWAALRPKRRSRPPAESGWLNGSCLLVRTEALREVGPLDERFFIFFEDTDLALRLSEAGWDSALCREAAILHHGHETVSQPAFGTAMERQMLRSRYLYFRKHGGPLRAAAVAALTRAAFLARALKALAESALAGRAQRSTAALLLELARYDPRSPLPHERPEGAAA